MDTLRRVLDARYLTPDATPQRRLAVVTAVDTTTGTATVTVGGDPTPVAGVPCLSSYTPAVGDTAVLDAVGGAPLLVGRPGGPETSMVEFKPAGNTDTAASATYATWITLGNVTVPTWASAARYHLHLAAVDAVTAGATVPLRLTVGGVAAVNDRTLAATTGLGIRFEYSWAGRVLGLSPGSRSVVVQYKRTSGTGALRVDTGSLCTAEFGWET